MAYLWGTWLAMAPAADGAKPSLISTLALPAMLFAVFYFLLIAPARKKQKLHQQTLENLKAGDKVVTTGGIHGTVVGISDQIVQVRIADQVKIEVSKQAVSAVQGSDS